VKCPPKEGGEGKCPLRDQSGGGPIKGPLSTKATLIADVTARPNILGQSSGSVKIDRNIGVIKEDESGGAYPGITVLTERGKVQKATQLNHHKKLWDKCVINLLKSTEDRGNIKQPLQSYGEKIKILGRDVIRKES